MLDDRHLTTLAKQLRHDLAATGARIPRGERHAARETTGDIGATVTTAAEYERTDAWHVATASLERAKQAIRSLEEYSKVAAPDLPAEFERLRYRVYTLEKAISGTRGARERLADARLYVLVDGRPSLQAFEELVASLAEAGVDILQLRDKQLTDRDLLQRAERLIAATRGTATLAIVNDRVDIAAAARADGVHLGQDELRVKQARGILGAEALIGVSTHAIDQARAAVLDGADYLGVGPTFPSTTKAFDALPGLNYARSVAEEITLPAFAIGGIDESNLGDVLAASVTRVAVAGCVVGSDDPAGVARRLGERLRAGDAVR